MESLQGQQRLVDAADGRVGSEIHLEPVAEKHLSRTISTPGVQGNREIALWAAREAQKWAGWGPWS